MRLRIARHPGPHIAKLVKDKSDDVRWQIAEKIHAQHPEFMQHAKTMAKDPNTDIRYHIAQVPGNHINILLKDKNPEVAKMANFTKNRK